MTGIRGTSIGTALFALITTLCIVIGWAVSHSSTSLANEPVTQLGKVAVIGDSFTAGSSIGGRGARGWPAIVSSFFDSRHTPVDMTVGAEPGSGYTRPGKHGSVFLDQVGRTLTADDQLVVFFGSINDASASPELLVTAIGNTLRAGRAAAPKAQLLVIGPAWADGNPPARILRDRDAVREQAAAAGARFVDPIEEHWFASQPDLIGSDGIHPTDAGHVYLAKLIVKLISQELLPAADAG